MERIKTRIYANLFTCLSFALVFFVYAHAASAASLYFSPSSGAYAIGDTFSVGVYVSSADQAMNAASGAITFSADRLSVVSLSKVGSIFNLWAQEPSFSNTLGSINFEGIVLNPGFIGQGGKILGITFKLKAAGVTPITFSTASVLANDGNGTDILSDIGTASFQLGNVGSVSYGVSPSQTAGTPLAPQISSPTHPDPNKWYANSNPKFTWELPQGVTKVSLLFDKFPQSVPEITYSPPVSSKKLTNIDDGTWYFHAQFQNSYGWGDVAHFRFRIDTQKPDYFNINEIVWKDLTQPQVQFKFDASDKTSGIDHYEAQIDNSDFQTWKDDGSHVYQTPILAPGKHILIAKAMDGAGNSLDNSAEFSIDALEAPVITDWPRELKSGGQLIVKGTSKYPNAQVVVYFQRANEDPKSQTINADNEGNFFFASDEKLNDGVYKLWAVAIDKRGAQSDPSEKLTFVVQRSAFLQIGSWVVGLLTVAVPLIALILLLLFGTWYGWYKFILFRNKMRLGVEKAELTLHRTFDLLKEDIQDHVRLLEKTKTKRQLTEEEEKILRQLKKDLNDTEKFVAKDLEDMEKGMR